MWPFGGEVKDKLWVLLFGGTVAVIFAAGVSTATWGKKYLEFPTAWAQEAEKLQRRFYAEAKEERQQTLLFREMLATQKWDSCLSRDEEPDACKAQQDSMRRVWFVQDSIDIVRDTAGVE
jgi:hypothetical protein